MRQEDFAVAALRFAFHIGAQVGGGARVLQHAVENRHVRRHIAALQRFVFKAEQFARRFVGQFHPSGLIEREDGERAGFDQNPHLLLRLLPQENLPLAFRQMVGQVAPALVQRGDEEACHREARDHDADAFGGAGSEPQRVEGFAQEAATRGHEQNLPGIEGGRGQQDGEQIEEADRDVKEFPIHPGDSGGQQSGDHTDGEAARFRVRKIPI